MTRRIVYLVSLGGGTMAPIQRWEWCYSECAWRPRNEDKDALEAEVKQHKCKVRK